VMRAALGATDVMPSDGTDATQRDESHKLDSGPGRGIFDYRDFMSISFRLPRSRARIWALPFVLGLGLSTYGCGDGGGDCGGPFCIGLDQPSPTRLKLGVPSGNGQTGATGRELPQSLQVVVTDDNDRPVQDVVVTFSVGQGSGSLSETEIRSDVQGRARATWTLGTEPGPQSAQAAASGTSGSPLSGSPLIFSAQAERPPPARIVLRQAPSVAVRNGIPLEQQPIVEVLDSEDQPVPQVQITAAIASGGGTLSGTTAVVSDATGRAAYSDLALVGSSGARTLRFSVVNPALEVVSGAIIVGAGGPSQITGVAPLTYQGTVGSPVRPPPSVVVKDAAGNPVPGVSVSFTTDRDASISPETVNTDDNGVAQVTSWILGTAANVQYTLTARVEGSTLAPVRFTATGRAGAAGGLRIVAQPSSPTQNGVPFTQQPVIQIVDREGNPAPQADVRITASAVGPQGGVLRNEVATTDAGGKATFSGLTLVGGVGNYVLTFSAPSLAGVNSSTITLTVGPPAQIALITAPPAIAHSRDLLGSEIQVQDVGGNPVPQPEILVTASLQGGGILSGETAATDATGKAVFTALAITGPPGAKTITFSSPSVTQTVAAQVKLPEVAKIEVNPSTPASGTVGTTLTAEPVAILKDVAGQPVPDAPFTLTPGAGTVSVTPTTGISGVGGAVIADSWQLGNAAGDQAVEISVSGTAAAVSPLVVQIQGTAAAPAALQMVSGDGQSAPPGTDLPAPLVVQILDQYGNGVPDASVQWRACDGSVQSTTSTDGQGLTSITVTTGQQSSCVKAHSPSADAPTQVSGSPVTFNYSVTAAASMLRSRTKGPVFKSDRSR
jgi:adhesin/invasin